MSQIDIQDLFDKSRFPSGWRLISLLIYTPVGLILVLLRLLITLQLWLLASLLPDSDTFRIILNYGLSFAFGIMVKVHSEDEHRTKESRIIIANNVSVLDHFALRRATRALTPSVWELPTALSNALGLCEMDMSSKDALIANIKQFLSTTKSNVALQPEFGTTNSRVALLKFNSWPFSIETSVQPVALSAWRPEFASVHLTSLASTWWTDVFWFMFVPYTVFTLKYLKVKRNTEYETLVREVEKDIAGTLGVQTSSHTVSDKTEFEKRCIIEKTHSRQFPRQNAPNLQVIHSLEIQRMARQVSEVLPLVPHNVILKDLLKTRNVDITITNILDGIVTYTPEPTPTTIMTAMSLSRLQKNAVKDNGAMSTSFQERKAKMIREARERYIQKHGLKNC
ncbi:hypothetical protein KM043_017788 [Ampulex compressa]|nr:hypothetical protein KM043_017788 [Ampulex compressa]